MSAVLSQPPRPKVPELSTELLLYIFRLATEVPSFLDPEDIVNPSFLSEKEQLKLSSHVLVTKRYLVRVSKYFYQIATPFLYEHLIVVRGRALPKLQFALESRSECDSLGKWTKRIDFSIRDAVNVEPKQFTEYMTPILRCLPNLQALVIDNSGEPLSTNQLPYNYLDQLPFKHSLEVIHCKSTSSIPRLWYPTLTASFPNLRGIADIGHVFNGYNLKEGYELNLPSLETLQLESVSPIHYYAKLPNLKHIALPIHNAGRRILSNGNHSPLILNHGHQLTTVRLFFSTSFNTTFALETLCPNLRRLDVILSSWTLLPGPTHVIKIPHSIITLGLECTTKQAVSFYYRGLVRVIENFDIGPGFKEIVLMEEGNVKDFKKHGVEWQSLVELARRRRLLLLGPDGQGLS